MSLADATASTRPLRVTPRSAWRPEPGATPALRGNVHDVIDLLRGGGVVALTGAGMSTESGIPDYRGPDGSRRVTPMTIDEFRDGEAGARRYWSRAYVGWNRFRAARANAGHAALARIQSAGCLDAVITQNVDGLHQEAGSRRVIELHGTLTRVVCVDCGARLLRDRVQAALTRLNPGYLEAALDDAGSIRPDGDVDLPLSLERRFRVARCEECAGVHLKPDVVFFGESADRQTVQACYEAVDRAQALLVLGSSLAVMSGLRFVRHAAARGLPVAIITNGTTRGENLPAIRLLGPLGTVLPEIAEAVRAG